MKIRHIISITFGLIISFMIYLTIHLGVFKSVEFSEGISSPRLLIAMDHVGAYHKIVPSMELVETWVKSQGQSCKKTFGIFLDDPKMVEQDRLRAQVGCILDGPLQNTPPETMKLIEQSQRQVITARFQGSPAIGPYKVYMKVNSLLEERGLKLDGGAMEIYEIHGPKDMTTEYEFPYTRKF